MWELGCPLSQPSSSRQVVVSCRDVAVGPKGVPLILDLFLELQAGVSIAVTGPSGSGKTTLLHCLAGLRAPLQGSISLLGNDFGGASDTERARLRGRHVGIVLQFGELLPELTVAENVALPIMLGLRHAVSELHKDVTKQLCVVGLSGFENRWPASLSGGEVQRVAIARALIGGPTLILADEPTGSLDAQRASDVSGILLSAAHEAGAVVVIATHNSAVAKRCQFQYRIEQQHLIAS